jgi:hypothetical protein
MLPVSLDCPFLIAPSMFSNVYIMYYDVSRHTMLCFLTWPIMLSHVTKYSMQKQQILVYDRNLYIILHGNDLELYLIRAEITWAEHWIWWHITSDENSIDFDNASFKYIKATGYDNS